MYRRILIPLDGSKEAEGVLPFARQSLAPEGEIVLLKVLLPAKTQTLGGHTVLGSQIDEAEQAKALIYLKGVCREVGEETGLWRCEVIFGESVGEAIVDFAQRDGVDLIAMYTHDRKGLAGLIRKSIARDVERKAPIEVKVYRPQEIAAVP